MGQPAAPHLDRHVLNLPLVVIRKARYRVDDVGLAVREIAPLAQILVALVEAALLDEKLLALIAQLAAPESVKETVSDEHGWVVGVGEWC